jgi:hypothetical protein
MKAEIAGHSIYNSINAGSLFYSFSLYIETNSSFDSLIYGIMLIFRRVSMFCIKGNFY